MFCSREKLIALIEHNNKQKFCNFFVVLGSGKTVLGMLAIEILGIITINCNTIGTQETNKAAKCSTNTVSGQGLGCEQHCRNTRQ